MDKTLNCADCGTDFVFTEREQEFYASKQFTEPRRCPSCRASRKAARGESSGDYSGGGYSSSGGYSSGADSYSGGPRGYDRGPRVPREMFTAVCSQCGGQASVPFKPTQGKPVYCSDCFRDRH